jgi:predicted nicotinamide N-methyase
MIFTEHRVTTPLSLVGEQVWRGALLLGDFILTHAEIFSGKSVLELGAGTGISSVAAAMVADRVICTGAALFIYELLLFCGTSGNR